METLKNIFVSYEIAQKLKEIGFDEPCISYYEKDNPNVRLNEKTQGTIKHNGLLIYVSAPTWEQVFDWFRSKNFYFSIIHSYEESESWYNVIHIELDFYKDVDLEDKDSDGHYYYDISGGFKGNVKDREEMIKTAIQMYENFIHEKNFLKNGKNLT
ncbi:hypothetical protein CAPN008_01080 [Capnocytophaga canis]|uniref:hypothetical protein n=1 Tax=Capnocytophaga canis TaxID=1848903 RepID=UPI001AC1FDFF|nr:hypothetical protein [Capnocytophaga canis]GIM60058.1 hypothetical protein CAPN008_01080 [Capnocytophaga canis]